jgi:gliding motility-associated-like protein
LNLIAAFLLVLSPIYLKAQDCPPNIDFERGDFTGWTCYVGNVSATGNSNNIYLSAVPGPVPNQHYLYSASSFGGFTDIYGGFPVICPNGGNYSLKLGNNEGGAQAEGVSYQFTIPSNRNTYSLIYHYAVVFQDPNHQPFQQPRLELEIKNMTDDQVIGCSSFTFFPNGSPLPGFYLSPLSDTTPVWCKSWTAVTINLNNMAGKSVRLFFKTADCTFRRHFGYAYIDVNSECSTEFTGATYCPDDTAVNLTAPYGYQNYNWFDNNFTTLLGTDQNLHLAPPPPRGSIYAVELIPWDGYGCRDTLYANLVDTLRLKANAGLDAVSCNTGEVQIGGPPKAGVFYEWTPGAGLSASNISNPRASPAVTTAYVLQVKSTGGGCLNNDTVVVKASIIDSTLRVEGKSAFCITAGDSAVLSVQPVTSIQWKKDGAMIAGATGTRYKVLQPGNYEAYLVNSDGCSVSTRTETIKVEYPKPGIRYPVQYALLNTPIELKARGFGASVLWSPATYLDEPNSISTNFLSPILVDKQYTIAITTALGCVTVDTQLVKTIKEVKIYVPTGFTPDNNGRNDYLRPILIGIKELRFFRIYNRWGQLVYDIHTGDERGWDGNIGGMIQQTSVFVWMIEGIGLDNKRYFQKGTVTLIR